MTSPIISDQIRYYLAINRGNFLQIQYDFYRHVLQIHYQLWWFVIESACTKNSSELMPGTWLFGASWWKLIKALLLYEIAHVSLFFEGRSWKNEFPGQWQGLEDWNISLKIKYFLEIRFFQTLLFKCFVTKFLDRMFTSESNVHNKLLIS